MTQGPFLLRTSKDLCLFSFTCKLRRQKVQLIVTPYDSCSRVRLQARVAQRLDNTIRRINQYSVDKCWQNNIHYPLDSELSGGKRSPPFEQMEPDLLK